MKEEDKAALAFASQQSRSLMKLPGMFAGLLVWLLLFATRFVPEGRYDFFGWHINWRPFGVPYGVTPLAGLALMMAGVMLFIWTVVLFSANRETIDPGDQTKRFIIAGPYCYSTHPMFAGVFGMQLGTAIWFGSGAMLVYFGVFAVCVVTPIVIFEYRRLSRTYGAPYRKYVRSTLIPWRLLLRRPYSVTVLVAEEPAVA